jgi:HPt (histidine-containing phosphotransfer) domain-containing protein
MASLGNEGAIMTQVARRVETRLRSARRFFAQAAVVAIRRQANPAVGEATMPTTYAAINRFPGTVSALLAWADGDTDRLAATVTSFRAQAPGLVRSLAQNTVAGKPPAVIRDAHSLYGMLAHFGVPQHGDHPRPGSRP